MQTLKFVNGTERQTDWNAINWRKASKAVRNLRQRIFRATREGDLKTVRSLQKLMLKSYSNTVVSVRRVTQVNDGRNTPGVDKLLVKTPEARGKLVDQLMEYQVWKAKPARRVYIPKANNKLRPLGIPTITDRCLQAKVKNALEPNWECKFEGNSFGFRPGRGCHDAIQAVYTLSRPTSNKKWILDADIKGAFDNISHEFLVKAIGEIPGKELIKQWLKAGYMEKGVTYDVTSGTPQGGIISPLLANIALHGMDEALGVYRGKNGDILSPRGMVRYADDFVVFCESLEDAQKAKEELIEWLCQRGLSFSDEKTKIVHITEGFNFLGFNIRQYKSRINSATGFKLLTKPSNESVKKLKEKLKEEWLRLTGHSVPVILDKLNPIIRGWANYFRIGTSSKIFQALDSWMLERAYRYAKRKHPMKSWEWRKEKYWGQLNPEKTDRWVFGDKDSGRYLLKFGWVKIQRHVKVKGASSPDDPTLIAYWQKREMAKSNNLLRSRNKLARFQNYMCPLCGESLFNGEEINLFHKVKVEKGEINTRENLALLHYYCHKQLQSKK